ncbi:MAG: hypothetical protein AAF441_08165 [Pseudomonadota bacterium]
MSEREEIELLLPWYVTGKLEPSERARVDAYLASHDDLDLQLAAIRDDQDNVITFNEQIAAPAAGGLDRLMARLDAEEPEAPRRASFMEALQSLFGAWGSPALKLAAAALVVLVVAQSVALTTLISGQQPGSTFETASGSGAGEGVDLMIGFKPDATAEQIRVLLEDAELSIVGGPLPGGLFEIRLNSADGSDGELDAVIARLAKRGELVGQVMRAE